jgi:hypothetical protein
MRETRLRRLARLELLPQGQETRARIVRQHPEDALDRHPLGRLALGQPRVVVHDGVARIDLADVVDQQHRDDAVHVEPRVGEFTHRRANKAICQLCSAEFS